LYLIVPSDHSGGRHTNAGCIKPSFKQIAEKTIEIDQQLLASKPKYNDLMSYKANPNIVRAEEENLIVLRVMWQLLLNDDCNDNVRLERLLEVYYGLSN
jgi:hypothetical protein